MTGLWANDPGDALLLLEHPPTYTLGVRADLANVLVPPASVGAELVRTDRGGDVTFHGPGQLVGYPILNVGVGPNRPATTCTRRATPGRGARRLRPARRGAVDGYPGVWVGADKGAPRKIAAIGVRVSKGPHACTASRSTSTRPRLFGNIVPCGISEIRSRRWPPRASTCRCATSSTPCLGAWRGGREVERQDVAWGHAPDDLAAFSRAHSERGAPVGRLAGAPGSTAARR